MSIVIHLLQTVLLIIKYPQFRIRAKSFTKNCLNYLQGTENMKWRNMKTCFKMRDSHFGHDEKDILPNFRRAVTQQKFNPLQAKRRKL